MNVRIGPIAIGHDDRPWIVRQLTRGWATTEWRSRWPDVRPGRRVIDFRPASRMIDVRAGRRLIDFRPGGRMVDFRPGGRTIDFRPGSRVIDVGAAGVARLADRLGWMPRRSRTTGWTALVGSCALGLAGGAMLAYVFDPTAGRRRRAIARDRAAGLINRAGRRLGRLGRGTAARGRGWLGKATHPRFSLPTPVDDVVLVDRVKAVLFREHDFPKGRISIDAVEGCVSLRGEIERYEQIDQIEAVVWGVPGVNEVENLLHIAGTPAPNTITALDAGR